MSGGSGVPAVIAAIPNYNMGHHLARLLPQVLEQNYDAVYVLDDASSDDTDDVVARFGPSVSLVRSGRNQGAGANRNQIIDHVADDDLIHFIDADMDLDTADTPAVARELFARYADDGVGMIGGLVSRADGTQEPHNYGAVFSLWGGLTSGLPLLMDRLRNRPRMAAVARRLTATVARGWPDVLGVPKPAPAYWLHEGNMVVHAGVLRSLGGYDPMIRSHEAQDLAIRMEQRGVKRQFDPAIAVLHHHIDVRGKNRNKWEYQAALYLVRKHGLYRWLTDR